MLSSHDFRAAPQTVQTASPVCGTKNFSSVRLYSAPQLHCTIVAIRTNMRFGLSIFQPGTYALCHVPLRPTFAGPSNARAAVERAAYDEPLKDVDLLLMPTLPLKATLLPARDASREDYVARALEMISNTCPFDVTGHPAATVPAGMSAGRQEALILVAETGGPTMLARIGVMRALNRHIERVFNPDRKATHWGKRKLKRDQ